MAEENFLRYKVILIGDSGVGKTAIIDRLSDNVFNEHYISTMGVDFRCKDIDVDGEIIRLQVWDTAGQERFRSIASSYCRGAHVIVVVYAIDSTKTFQSVRTWLTEIVKRVGPSDASNPIIKYLVGNKSDLEDARCISEEDGVAEAEKYGIKFIETSAKSNKNIEELFTLIAKDIKETFKPVKKDSNTIVLNTSKEPKSGGGCCRKK